MTRFISVVSGPPLDNNRAFPPLRVRSSDHLFLGELRFGCELESGTGLDPNRDESEMRDLNRQCGNKAGWRIRHVSMVNGSPIGTGLFPRGKGMQRIGTG